MAATYQFGLFKLKPPGIYNKIKIYVTTFYKYFKNKSRK